MVIGTKQIFKRKKIEQEEEKEAAFQGGKIKIKIEKNQEIVGFKVGSMDMDMTQTQLQHNDTNNF